MKYKFVSFDENINILYKVIKETKYYVYFYDEYFQSQMCERKEYITKEIYIEL